MSNVLKKEVNDKTYPIIQEMITQSVDTGDDVIRRLDKAEIVGSGKGKFALYDKTIPSYLKKYGKKWNAKVYDDAIEIENPVGSSMYNEGSIPVTVLELSPEMKI